MSGLNWHALELLTIHAEQALKDRLKAELARSGLHFTISEGPAESFGSLQVSDWADDSVRVEVLGTVEAIELLAERLAKRYFPHHQLVLYSRSVRVLRPERFSGPAPT